jgi:hypothetical protein
MVEHYVGCSIALLSRCSDRATRCVEGLESNLLSIILWRN